MTADEIRAQIAAIPAAPPRGRPHRPAIPLGAPLEQLDVPAENPVRNNEAPAQNPVRNNGNPADIP
ncbi:hypothetical protein H0H81_011653, partial [Sphagnurus paluster]